MIGVRFDGLGLRGFALRKTISGLTGANVKEPVRPDVCPWWGPLVAEGAPVDEYAAEADAILGLRGVPQLTEITGVFAVSFGDPGACTRETARWIAEEMVRRAEN